MCNPILSTLSILVLLMHPLSLAAQNSVSPLLNIGSPAGDKAVASVNMYEDEIVAISDANLRAVIEDSLGKVSGEPITREEMATLTRLDAPNKNIRDLTGLESAIGLKMLIVGGEIENGKPVNSNTISDVSALSSLTNLRILDLSFNAISDVSPLSDMTHLLWLSLSSNTISDVSALSDLTSLKRLYLDKNTISDVSALSDLTRLEKLFLDNNTISDVSALSGLTSLTWLYLHNNMISDVSALSNLTRLERLSLDKNTISDVSALSNLTRLEKLFLDKNTISDVSALSNLTHLERLFLDKNTISDVSALSDLTRLTLLSLSSNTISDVSALSGLTRLKRLWLSNNMISDLAPLVANMGLGSGDVVYVRKNPLSTTSINKHISALKSKGVDVYFRVQKPAIKKKEPDIIRGEVEPFGVEKRGVGD